MTKKIDRRVLRTRKQLSEALFGLIFEKEYESITIQDITDRADLNRATFYLHYGTKEELLAAALEQRFDLLVAQMDNMLSKTQDWSDPRDVQLVFDHAAANLKLYQLLLGDKGQVYIVNRVIEYIAAVDRRICEQSVGDVGKLPIPVDVMNHFTAGALFSSLRWWVLNDMPHSAENMATWVCAMCSGGILPIVAPFANQPLAEMSA